MDTKRFILAMALSFVLIFGWQQGMNYLDKKHPEWNLLHKPVPAATQPVSTVATSQTATSEPTSAPSPGALHVAGMGNAQAVTLGSATPKDPNYAMQLVLSPDGAGVNAVTLNDFNQAVGSKADYSYEHPLPDDANATRPMSTQWVSINGEKVNLAGVAWRLEKSGPNSATFSADIEGPKGPLATVLKTYTLAQRGDRSGGYEVTLAYGFVNRTDQPITVQTNFNGPIAPPRELDRGPDRLFIGGYLDIDRVTVDRHYIEELTPAKSEIDMTASSGKRLMWFGTSSVYFNAFVRPDPIEQGQLSPNYIEKVDARVINPAAPVDQRHAMTSVQTTQLTVPAGKSLDLPMRIFFGPKLRGVIDNDYFSQMPLEYNKTLVTSGGMCGFLTFQWLINTLVWLLQSFHLVLRDWGLAIMALVVLVRVLLHPITKKAQINMVKMGKMGPEIERLKKKYGDNKDELNRAMMEFYKQQGATPILGCLPMFLQMPIWIALWSALQSTFELRHAPFFYGLTWIHDLAKPDHLITFPPITLPLGITLDSVNLLPILMGVMFFLQQKMTPKPPATTPEQQQQQKMMQWMSLLFPVFLYNGPAGLNLYIFTSTAIGIIESKIIRDHIKQREEAEKEGKVFVSASTRASRRVKPGEETKRGGIGGFIGNLQAKVEEMRNEKDKR